MIRLRDRLYSLTTNGDYVAMPKALGVSPKTFNKWLNGRQLPTPTNLHKLHVRFPHIFVNDNIAYWTVEVPNNQGATNRVFHNRLKYLLTRFEAHQIAARCGTYERSIETWTGGKLMPQHEVLTRIIREYPTVFRGDMYEPEDAAAGQEFLREVTSADEAQAEEPKETPPEEMPPPDQEQDTQDRWISIPEKWLVDIADMVFKESDRWTLVSLTVKYGMSSRALALILDTYAKNS